MRKLTEAQLVERGRELVALLAEIDKAEEARAEANAEAKSAIKALEGRADALREVISSGEEEGEQGRLFEGGGRVTSVTLTAADGRRIAKSMGKD